MNYFELNKEAWEEAFDRRAPAWGADVVQKVQTESYPFFVKDMAAVLKRYDFDGKIVAQFCCNNGRELLSLVKGSHAGQGYGFDIAENMVNFANRAAKQLNLNCVFKATNILDVDAEFYETFDVLIITIGALCWFKELDAFFNKAAACLKKDGVLIINEQHPVTNMLGLPGEDNYREDYPANLVNPYFSKEWIETNGMYYMTLQQYPSKTFVNYSHSFSEIINGMCRAGLSVRALHEFDYDISDGFTNLDHQGLPLSYIIEAQKSG
ncbi:MAG: methyltransferase domain-containing protein [Anaerolineae bacterium]|nr:methyltransferase domain-containing protein [Anaerolineae bacterium]